MRCGIIAVLEKRTKSLRSCNEVHLCLNLMYICIIWCKKLFLLRVVFETLYFQIFMWYGLSCRDVVVEGRENYLTERWKFLSTSETRLARLFRNVLSSFIFVDLKGWDKCVQQLLIERSKTTIPKASGLNMLQLPFITILTLYASLNDKSFCH